MTGTLLKVNFLFYSPPPSPPPTFEGNGESAYAHVPKRRKQKAGKNPSVLKENNKGSHNFPVFPSADLSCLGAFTVQRPNQLLACWDLELFKPIRRRFSCFKLDCVCLDRVHHQTLALFARFCVYTFSSSSSPAS